MVRVYSILILLLISSIAYTQTKASLIKEFDLEKGYFFKEFLGKNESHVYFLSRNNKEELINAINLNTFDIIKFKLPEFNSSRVFIENDIIKVFSVSDNNKELQLNLQTLSVNLSQLKSVNILAHQYTSKRFKGDFKVVKSQNGELYAVLDETIKDLNDKETIRVHVFDKNDEILWKKDYKTSFKQSSKPKNSITLDNKGNVNLLKKVSEHKTQSFHYFHLTKEAVKTQKIKFPGIRIKEITQITKGDGTTIFSGLFSTDNLKKANGYFNIFFNENGNKINQYNIDFPPRFSTAYYRKSSSAKEISNIYIQTINHHKNGFYISYQSKSIEDKERDKNNKLRSQYKFENRIGCFFDMQGDILKIDSYSPVEHWGQNYISNLNFVQKDSLTYSISSKIYEDDDIYAYETPSKKNELIINNLDEPIKDRILSLEIQDKLVLSSSNIFFIDEKLFTIGFKNGGQVICLVNLTNLSENKE